MGAKRPIVLSIAGFDPSGGAGVLADIKTFEQCGVLGMGIATSITYQNEAEFEGLKWLETEEVVRQYQVLARKNKFQFVKIGLIRDLEMLSAIIDETSNNGTKLIWDPVMKATAGYDFNNMGNKNTLNGLLKKLYLITPNTEEACAMSGMKDPEEGARLLAEHCKVYLKGGHSEVAIGRDHLFADKKVFSFRARGKHASMKHGSGCVLSSALTSYLARGFKLHPSCVKAKGYVTGFLSSNKTLLGYHN